VVFDEHEDEDVVGANTRGSHRHLHRQSAHIRHLNRQHRGSKRVRSSEKPQVRALSYTCGVRGAVLYTEEVGGFESLIAHQRRSR